MLRENRIIFQEGKKKFIFIVIICDDDDDTSDVNMYICPLRWKRIPTHAIRSSGV